MRDEMLRRAPVDGRTIRLIRSPTGALVVFDHAI